MRAGAAVDGGDVSLWRTLGTGRLDAANVERQANSTHLDGADGNCELPFRLLLELFEESAHETPAPSEGRRSRTGLTGSTHFIGLPAPAGLGLVAPGALQGSKSP